MHKASYVMCHHKVSCQNKLGSIDRNFLVIHGIFGIELELFEVKWTPFCANPGNIHMKIHLGLDMAFSPKAILTDWDTFGSISKKEKVDIWISPMTKVPKSREKSKKQGDNTKRHQKLRLHGSHLRIDLGRSVWVTTAAQLMSFNRSTESQPTNSPQ